MSKNAVRIRTSAPGKLMLFGEHAVLYGYPCLVAAVTPRAHVELIARSDSRVLIHSELGQHETTLENLSVEAPFTFVLEAIRRSNLPSGIELTVSCEFPPDVGLGSSAAVTVAVVAALKTLTCGENPSQGDVFLESLAVVRAVQGSGSGADLAASTYGGVLFLKSGGKDLRRLPCRPDVVAVYSGAKEKTAAVIEKVRQAHDHDPVKFDHIFESIGRIVEAAEGALTDEDWDETGRLMARNQLLMAEMGVSNEALEHVIAALLSDSGIFGAKISGSGLGDCVWGLGILNVPGRLKPLDLALDTAGLTIY